MRLLCRILGAVALVLATVGIVCCVAGVVGIWMVRPHVVRRVEEIDTRVTDGLQRLSTANQSVRRALDMARADVRRVRKESADLGLDPEANRRAAGVLRKLIHKQVGPNINELGGKLAISSDAALAVASMLRSFQESPLGETGRIEADELERATDQASKLSAALQKLQTTIGEEEKATTEPEVVVAANDVDIVLQKCQEKVNEWQSKMDSIHKELPPLKARILHWLTPATIAVTILCAWVGLGQLSLFAHAWKWVRGA